jgi:Sulfotransferase family
MKVKNPIFIIGCPRSGTTLLFTVLRSSTQLWSSPDESHYVWEKFLADKRDPMFSMYLQAEDFSDGDREYIENKYAEYTHHGSLMRKITKHVFLNRFKNNLAPFFLMWRKYVSFLKSLSQADYRVIDKTPPNTYRVDYLAKTFPDAKFIYLTRNGASNISSLIEGWKSEGRFSFAFRQFYDYNSQINIKGYKGKVWKFTNPPGWQNYLNKTLEEVCAFQWLSAHKYSQEAFQKMSTSRWMPVKYEDLTSNPEKVLQEICHFLDLDFDGSIKQHSQKLPVVSTSTKPAPDKWLKNKDLIENIADKIDDMQIKLGYPSLLNSSAHSNAKK